MPILNAKRLTLSAKRGFTLIELLVVIAIIAILVTIAVASFATAQAKGRDARRKTDLDAIKKALELYKTDNAGGNYPACALAGANGTCAIDANADFSQVSGTPDQPTDVYFGNVFPKDPKNSGTCPNVPINNAATGNFYAGNVGLVICYAPQGTAIGGGGADNLYPGYVLSVCLENKNDSGPGTFDNAAALTKCVSDTVHGRTYGITHP